MLERYRCLSERQQRWLITLGFMLAQVIIFAVIYQLPLFNDRDITDTPVYFRYATWMAHGWLPYRDFSVEYPPVAVLIFSLPRLLSGQNYWRFVFIFQAEMMVFSWAIVGVISSLAWRQWRSLGKVAGALAAYTLFLIAMGSVVEARFDLAAAFIILAAIACFVTDRYLLAWILLGVGMMTKVVPLLLGPVFLIAHLRRRQYGWLWLGPLAVAATALVISIPFLFSGSRGTGGLLLSFVYHADRPVQIESIWASPLELLAQVSHSYYLHISNTFGSHNIYGTGAGLLAAVSAPLTAVFLLLGYLRFFRRSSVAATLAGSSGTVLRFSALAIAIFVAGGKVLSPQFMIWLIPLVPLVKGADRKLILGIFAVVLLLTQIEFPYNYWQLYGQQPWMVVEVAVRNAMLVALAAAIALGPLPEEEPAGRLSPVLEQMVES